jgi:hypothetical protein
MDEWDWLPIETKPPFKHVEERGEYRTDDGMLWYFKPTHWRPIDEVSNDHKFGGE